LKQKNRIVAILFVLTITTFLIISLYLLNLKIGWILIIAAIPASIYSIHFGIRDYHSFFLEKKVTSNPFVIEFDNLDFTKEDFAIVDYSEFLGIESDFWPALFELNIFKDTDLFLAGVFKDIEFGDAVSLYASIQLDIPSETNPTKNEYNFVPEKQTDTKPIRISLTIPSFAPAV